MLIGIVGAKLTHEKINYVPFMEDELIVVSSPSLRGKKSMTLQELMKFPMIVREEGSGTRKEVEKILERRGMPLDRIRIASIFGSTDAVKQAVKAGLGISIVSRLSVVDELKHKVLQEIRLTDIKMKRNFYTVTHKKRTLPKAYRVFLDYIRTEAKSV